MRKYKLNYKTILRNILIILAITGIIKYANIMNNYNNKLLADYNDFVEYAKNNNIAVTEANYNDYINTK